MTTNYNSADLTYAILLQDILLLNNVVETRNHSCYCNPFLDNVTFDSLPLITVRKTAWKLALTEMEWFMSGSLICPEKLSKWWTGQLDKNGRYLDGYSIQFRESSYGRDEQTSYAMGSALGRFDQIAYILEGLKNHQHSRRLVMTSWNTGEMANITKTNNNPQCPSTCHGSLVQFFVVDGTLHLKHYQRSADMLLGIPHNLVQYWALLTYFAFHANLKVGSLTWVFGDAHIYNEESHIEAANQIIKFGFNNLKSGISGLASLSSTPPSNLNLNLVYNYSGELDSFGTPRFAAADFTIEGDIPKPTVLTKPKLL
jgi:thymidylate synthase